MIWYLGITVILLGYIALYWRRGITHPIPITLAYWVLMLPFKYFLNRALGVPFMLGASNYDVDLGGMYLFFFLVVTAVFHLFFGRMKGAVPLVETVPRINFWLPGIGLIGLILLLFIVTNGVDALTDSLRIRAFTNTGGMAYIELLLEFCMVVGLVQVAEGRSRLLLILYLLVFVAYFLLMARAGLLVVLLTFGLAYLCMVRRIVPSLMLFALGGLLAPVVLVQGILRQRGGYTEEAMQWLLRNMDVETGSRFAAAAFGSRVSQIDSFALLARRLHEGTLPTDPIEPLYVFGQAIPRSLWPDKPRMFADHATTLVTPRIHEIGTVLNFIGPAELMYAFGIFLGIVLSGLICGYLFAVCDRYYIFSKGRPYAFVFFCVIPFLYLGASTQSGFFNSIAVLLLLFYGALLVLLFRFRIVREGQSSLHETAAPEGTALQA